MRKTIHAQGDPSKNATCRIKVTMPDWLFDWIKKEAVENHRSISSQIVVLLENTVPPNHKEILKREGVWWQEAAE